MSNVSSSFTVAFCAAAVSWRPDTDQGATVLARYCGHIAPRHACWGVQLHAEVPRLDVIIQHTVAECERHDIQHLDDEAWLGADQVRNRLARMLEYQVGLPIQLQSTEGSGL